MSRFEDVTIAAQDSPSIDAFQRWRVSNPLTIFDSKQIHDNAPFFWDDSQVSGDDTTSIHSSDTARTRIGVALNTAGKRVRQTFRRFNYQPGKSQTVFMTSVLTSAAASGVKSKLGLFDDDNGVFLNQDGTTLKVVQRTKTSGSPVDTEIAQSAWNLDKMDGTGASGITIDTTKTQIFIIDFEWLGVGRMRCGFVINGLIVYFHEFLNANNLTVVYMSTPNLPVRYSIENDGTGAATTMDHLCSTVISEGGQERNGILRHIANSGVSSLSSGTTYAMFGIRLQSAKIDASVILENLSLLATTPNDAVRWSLKWNPTVAGTFTYANETNSTVQTVTGVVTNTVTGGTAIDGGFFSTALPITPTIPNALILGADIAGVVDEIVLCVTPITNNLTVHASLTWRELS